MFVHGGLHTEMACFLQVIVLPFFQRQVLALNGRSTSFGSNLQVTLSLIFRLGTYLPAASYDDALVPHWVVSDSTE